MGGGDELLKTVLFKILTTGLWIKLDVRWTQVEDYEHTLYITWNIKLSFIWVILHCSGGGDEINLMICENWAEEAKLGQQQQ